MIREYRKTAGELVQQGPFLDGVQSTSIFQSELDLIFEISFLLLETLIREAGMDQSQAGCRPTCPYVGINYR